MNTAQERADWIRSEFGARFSRLLNEAAALARGDGNFQKRAMRMLSITDRLAETVAPKAVCRRGCSHCCNQSVIISSWEATFIGMTIGREWADVPKITAASDLEEMKGHYTGKPCVFLKDGECSIYDVRPLVCRTLFNMGDDPNDCDIINHPGGTVPYFNFRPLHLMQGVLFWNARCDFADIRDFFPSEGGD